MYPVTIVTLATINTVIGAAFIQLPFIASLTFQNVLTILSGEFYTMENFRDVRKEFVINISEKYFGKSLQSQMQNISHDALENFLNESNCFLLCIDCSESEFSITEKISEKKSQNTLVFYKISPCIITDTNVSEVLRICSVQNPPLNSFYDVLQKVYIPALFQNQGSAEDIKLQELFENMEVGIKSAITRKNLRPREKQNHSISGRLTLRDEYEYWHYLQVNSTDKKQKENARKIAETLEALESKFIESNDLAGVDESLEDAYNTLDDLWKLEKFEYSEENMINLFDVIGNLICEKIYQQLKKKNIWMDSYEEIHELISLSIEIGNRWIDSCAQLTKIFWPNYASHPWTGSVYRPAYIQKFVQRLTEILEVRNIHQNICQLLSKFEKEELKITDNFKVFSGMNFILYNPYTENIWKAALNSFNQNLRSAEEFVGKKIKQKLASCSGNILQLLEWFKRYQSVIQKEEIGIILKPERQNFANLLYDFVNDLSSIDFTSRNAVLKKFPPEIINLPDIILKIMWIKEIIDKLKNIENVTNSLLTDLTNFERLKNSITSLKKELQTNETTCFTQWCSDTSRFISGSNLSLKTNDPVVYFEQGKSMVVNYNPRLKTLIDEVHQLQLLGFKIPSAIAETATKADLFVKQAKALEQVANFHNTIGDRMIPSQRPMMLASAVELSNLVKSENTVTWSNREAVDKYIARLQFVVDRLSLENNQLYSYHMQILNKVTDLADADLLQQKNKWRDNLREIRDIIAEVKRKFSNTKSWLIHWDHQIYKVLQYRYQIGLLNLNEYLPEIKVELVYRQQKLQFNPPMEEIRTKYYTQLKKFITMPLTFQGVSDVSSSIFPVMVTRNADQFQYVYENAENLFKKLLGLLDEWTDKVALGTIDLENLAKNHIKLASDWDMNFRTSKAWGQEIAKIINCERKIECFTISVAPVRSEIELHNNRYWDVLSISLYASILLDINTIEEFIGNAKKSLEFQPRSLDEIGDAKDAYQEIVTQCSEISGRIEELDKKNQVLSSWTKEKVKQVSTVKQEWNNFLTSLDNQQFYINRQVESIKSKLISEAENITTELEKFELRWQRSRPKETDLVDGNYSVIDHNIKILKEKREEWNKLSENIERVRRDYSRFGISVPESLECEKIENELSDCEKIWGVYEQFIQELEELNSEEWIVFRGKSVSKFESFLQSWEEKLEKVEVTPLTARLFSDLNKYKDFIPVIKFLRGDAFSDKHWSELCTILKIPSKSIDKLVFGDFLKAQDLVVANLDSIQDLNSRASSEIVIRQALAELDMWEVEAKLQFMTQRDSRGKEIFLIKDFKEVLSKIGDNQCLLQSMISSPNYEQYRDHTTIWESKLIDLDYYLRNLNEIQRKWLYLEPIFKSETMKIEKARFERIDKDFHYVLEALSSGDQRVVTLCRIPNLRNIVDMLTQQISICQKSLNEYLEEKRLKFPKFYFLSDEDLLEILGQANKPEIVQFHLKKLFAGINSVVFVGDSITAVKSIEGEVVALNNSVAISLDVENWLNLLSVEVRNTLKQLLVGCLKNADPLQYPSQILCLAESVSFTCRCEEAIKQGKLKNLLSSLEKQLEMYTKLDLELEDKDSTVLELKLKALIFDTIYHIRILKDLIENSVTSAQHWHWQKQLRFYLQDNSEVILKMVDAVFKYSYEYQGNPPKLVHTPLTDRCYLTLTQAMSMGLGGNPYGPAGTGKTESVKALGRLFGRQVLVFNCDEGLDIQSLTRILIGLVKCGAWGCFDEFNRLEEATLSSVSTHIQVIQNALKNNLNSIPLLNRQIDVNSDTGIFVTMNPAGRGYGGRQKLPDNLKQLFRPIAMSVPDNLQIAEVILYSEGFKNAKTIARKLVEIFDMAKKILSPQKHYDWGLRALKTVIGGCKTAMKSIQSLPEDEVDEAALVVQVIRLNTLSKLTFNDAQRFDQLIKDTFPNVNFDSRKDTEIEKFIEAGFKDLALQCNPRQIRKCLELYEQLEQRMGVVIVGPSGSGKSTICRVLKQALINQKRTINQYTINPKSMPRTQLLGQIDDDTRQWIDGVLSSTAQRVYNEPSSVESWIVFDGDIDPEWIESLNSVLDDNRLLTLPSGWRIHFGPNIHFLFETHSLQHASPATISRMGIILLSEQDLDIQCIVESWLQKQTEDKQFILKELIEQYLYKALEWIQSQGELVAVISPVSLVQNFLSLASDVAHKSQFCVTLINGLGSVLTQSSRDRFSKMVLEWMEEFVPDANNSYFYYNQLRSCIDCYDCEYEVDSCVVKTAQLKYSSNILKTWVDNQDPFIIVGSHGIGKTQLLEFCIKEYRGIEIVTVHCGSQVSPSHILQKLNQACMIVSGNNGMILRPKTNERLILHLKDLNLMQLDKWGSNMLLSFLHQVLVYKGFYDQSQMEWVGVNQIQIVCSLLSCDQLNPRLINLNRLISLWPPDQSDLAIICSSYLKPLSLAEKLLSVVRSIVVGIYSKLKDLFEKTSSQYNINLRDLCNWCIGLGRYQIENNKEIIQALLYEGNRLFSDRLYAEEDKKQLSQIVEAVLESECGYGPDGGKNEDFVFISGDCKNRSSETTLTSSNLKDWISALEGQVTHLENEGEQLDRKILLNQPARIVAYFERVLSQPGGSLFLPGFSGFGRKTAIRIVAARQSAKVFSPKVFTGYGLTNFKHDIKTMLQLAGLENQNVYLLFEDYQIINETIMDYICSILISGEIPGLYNSDELETLCSPLRDAMSQNDFQGTPSQYFTERVKQNLHIIFIVDINHLDSTNNWKSNPILSRRCQTIWLTDWTDETKLSVLSSILTFCSNSEPTEKVDEFIVKSFIAINEDAKRWMNVTPRHFLTFVKTFHQIKVSKEKFFVDNETKLKAGLSKLTEAKSIVANLKKDAAEQETKLAEKQSKANAALDLITKTMQNASSQKNEMETLKVNMENESEILTARKKEIDVELAEVEPILAAARSAVGNIKSEALSEIRSLRAPPDVIHDILEGVLRLMGIQDTSWNSMKTFLAKRGVKEDIKCFDARNIFPENRQLVEELLQQREKSFEDKTAKRASAAAAPLAAWVIANVKYSRILEKIQPLEMEQNKLQNKLKQSKDEIVLLSSGLDDVNQTVENLKGQLNLNTKEAAEIQLHLSKAQETISTAEELVINLDEEYSRWSKQIVQFSSNVKLLPSNCLISSAVIVYLSHIPEDEQKSVLKKWLHLLQLEKFELNNFLSSEQEQLHWLSEGLPSDNLSLQNAVILSQLSNADSNTCLTSFILDPADTASKWLQNYLKKTKTVEVISSHSERLFTTLEMAVRFGKSLIIKDVTVIDPILVPILRRNFICQGTRKLVLIGDKLVDFNAEFRLYLVCRDAKISIPTYFAPLFTIVNFEITYSGLSQQLLRCALSVEKPDLERRRVELLKKEENLKIKLFTLQDKILMELANAQGNILENKELLVSLKESKASSSEITVALEESARIRNELTEECEVYRPLAENGATLYFNLLSLQTINNFYKISVDSFNKIYQKVFSKSQEQIDFDMERKLRKLIHLVYYYVSRFLFKEDLLIFMLHLIRDMYPQCFQNQEWELFNKDILIDIQADSPQVIKVLPPWANKEQALDIFSLKQTLPELFSQLDLNNEKLWLRFIKTNHDLSELSLTPFQFVLVTQTFKPGSMYSALIEFCKRILGLRRLSPSMLQLDKLLMETSPSEPIMLIVSPGVDPSEELRTLAKAQVGSNFHEVALGRGQTNQVFKLLHESAQNGYWLILKNLHLMTSWLVQFEKEFRSLNKVHDRFRLWLTSEFHSNFPPTLVQLCLKIAYETPQGMKRNLERTYCKLANESFSSVEYAKTIFTLSWFHTIVQERRTYIPQGWCKFYEFGDSDLSTALQIVQRRFENDNKGIIKWNYVHGLLELAIYGGRIDNYQDLQVLKSYLHTYFDDDIIFRENKLLAPGIHIPNSTTVKDYQDTIQKLPETNLPELFALPLNVDLSWQKKRSSEIIHWLKMIRNQNIKNETDSELWKSKITPILHLWKQLNHETGILKMKPLTIEDGEDDLIRTFILQELNFGIKLINHIHKVFVNINKTLRNSVPANKAVLSTITDIINHQTPDDWLSLWEGNKNPISYIKNIMSRSSSILKLYKENDNTARLLAKSVDLKQFFNPQTFLSIFKQYSSRLSKNPLDDLTLECSWRDKVRGAPVNLTLKNLAIEGAFIEAGSLQKNSVDSPLLNTVPDFQIAWIMKNSELFNNKNRIEIPVYYDSSRENILIFVKLDVHAQDHDSWIQANVALYLQE